MSKKHEIKEYNNPLHLNPEENVSWVSPIGEQSTLSSKSSTRRSTLTFGDIEDEEDKLSRLARRTNYKTKNRKKLKLSYFSDESESSEESSTIHNRSLEAKHKLIEQKLTQPKSKRRDQESREIIREPVNKNKKGAIKLILNNFASLKLQEDFITYSNPQIQLLLFRLFLYAALNDQEKFFLEAARDTVDTDYFMERLEALTKIKELNYNFELRFTKHGTVASKKKTIEATRVTQKIEVPPLVLKRLGIEKQN